MINKLMKFHMKLLKKTKMQIHLLKTLDFLLNCFRMTKVKFMKRLKTTAKSKLMSHNKKRNRLKNKPNLNNNLNIKHTLKYNLNLKI